MGFSIGAPRFKQPPGLRFPGGGQARNHGSKPGKSHRPKAVYSPDTHPTQQLGKNLDDWATLVGQGRACSEAAIFRGGRPGKLARQVVRARRFSDNRPEGATDPDRGFSVSGRLGFGPVATAQKPRPGEGRAAGAKTPKAGPKVRPRESGHQKNSAQ